MSTDKTEQALPEPYGWLCDDGGSMRAFFRADELEARDEFIAQCQPLSTTPLYAAEPPAQPQEPVAWQERTQLTGSTWSEWYERGSGYSLNWPQEIESGGVKFQFRPLYASPPRAVEPQRSHYCLECERLSRELAAVRDALQEADTIMGHDDSETEWREKWAGLWPNVHADRLAPEKDSR